MYILRVCNILTIKHVIFNKKFNKILIILIILILKFKKQKKKCNFYSSYFYSF
jgi:hypothetical protein